VCARPRGRPSSSDSAFCPLFDLAAGEGVLLGGLSVTAGKMGGESVAPGRFGATVPRHMLQGGLMAGCAMRLWAGACRASRGPCSRVACERSFIRQRARPRCSALQRLHLGMWTTKLPGQVCQVILVARHMLQGWLEVAWGHASTPTLPRTRNAVALPYPSSVGALGAC
jgi:hypothetical protein